MKKLLTIIILFIINMDYSVAQSASDIMDKYTKVTGGKKNWDKVNSMKVTGIAKLLNQGGLELPFTRIMKKDGKQITSLKVNGMDYISIAFDGKIAWGSNQQMQPEAKIDDTSHNTMITKYDFPYPGHNWKQNGYTVDYLGKETVINTETYKIKLTKLPQLVDVKEVENILYLYLDAKKYVPILTESIVMTGIDKGKILRSFLSNYKEVNGLLYPFIVTMKYEEETFQILETETVEWNSEIDDSIFEMKAN